MILTLIWLNYIEKKDYLFDRATNLQLNKMQDKIYGLMVTKQNHAKWNKVSKGPKTLFTKRSLAIKGVRALRG